MDNLILHQIRKDYGKVRAVEGVDLTFAHGELTALLGMPVMNRRKGSVFSMPITE